MVDRKKLTLQKMRKPNRGLVYPVPVRVLGKKYIVPPLWRKLLGMEKLAVIIVRTA